MINRSCIITVNGNTASIDSDVFLYKNDKNIQLAFSIINSKYMYDNDDANNLISSMQAAYAQVKFKKDDSEDIEIEFDVQETKKGAVILTIGEELTDEDTELGDYTIQIRLLDSNKNSVITLPPVQSCIHILRPLFEKLGSDTNIVNKAEVNKAVATYSVALSATNEDGTFNKKTWVEGDKITTGELNRMEDGIDNVSTQYKDIANEKIVKNEDYIEQVMPVSFEPMVTFIDDDGKLDVMTKLLPIFKSRGVKASCAIITSLIDTQNNVFEGGKGKFLTTSNLVELCDEGWEMLGHGSYYASNMNNFINEEDLDDALNKKCKQVLELKGIKVNGFVYPQNNMANNVYNKVKEHYSFAFGGLDIANTSTTDVYKLNRIAFGCYTNTNKEVLGNNEKNTLEYYKSCIDYCKQNNLWIVFMLHVSDIQNSTANAEAIKDILPALLDYTIEQGVKIVTPSEGYAKLYDNNFLKKPIEKSKKVNLKDNKGYLIGGINFADNIYMDDGYTTLTDELKKIKELIKNGDYIEPASIVLNHTNVNIILGNTLQLIAEISPYSTTNKDIYWTTSDKTIATVTQKGVVTAISTGEVNVTATTVSKGISATCTISITEEATNVTGVSLNKNNVTIEVNKKTTLVAILIPSNVIDNTVIWSINNSNVSISSDGLNCIVTGVTTGTSIITVTTQDGNYQDSCTVTVTENVIEPLPYETDLGLLYDARNYNTGDFSATIGEGVMTFANESGITLDDNFMSYDNTVKGRSNSPIVQGDLAFGYTLAFVHKLQNNSKKVMFIEGQKKKSPYIGLSFLQTTDATNNLKIEYIPATISSKITYLADSITNEILRCILTVTSTSAKLYINGVLVAEKSYSVELQDLSDSLLCIGCTASESESLSANGSFGMFASYNRELNETEVAELNTYLTTVWS